jgi:16S rRNA (guanine527-N7)-methyltransferase
MSRGNRKPVTQAGESKPAYSVEQIAAILRRLDVEYGEAVVSQVEHYLALLTQWNVKVPLTSISDLGEVLERHFAESFFGAKVAGIKAGRMLDVGSGAGFPAVPIALVAPKLEVTLLEPNLKKAAFLKELCRQLDLTERVRVERTRFEDYRLEGRGFDFVTSRAVKITSGFLDRSAELLVRGGKVVLWMGQEDAAKLLENRGWIWGEPVSVPGSERRVILWGSPGGA